MWYTVFYTFSVGYAGTLGTVTSVKTSDKVSFEAALYKKNIDISQVIGVIKGKHNPIVSDWSKL